MASSRAIGPILAVGGITVANRVIFNGQPMEWRVPIATGIAAVFIVGVEKFAPGVAVGLAYTALAAVVLTRVDPGVPSPVESLEKWWNSA